MLSASLGSPATSHGKVPVNVVFIIDTHLARDVEEAHRKRAIAHLKRSLVRILLYFQCNMDAKFQWTYQFFNSRMHQDIGQIPNRVLQSLSVSTITACVEEYRRLVTAEKSASVPSGKGASTGGSAMKTPGHGAASPCFNLRRQLVHSLADFGLDISSYQSPIKPTSSFARSHSLQRHFPPVNIRNYMYILTPLPRTWAEMVSFLDGKQHAQNESNLTGPRRNDILEVLKAVKEAFFDQGLWDRFLDQRMSLSWIDTGSRSQAEELTKTRISATMLIRSTLEQIMKAFGGYIIPQKILCRTMATTDAYSFATVFQTYRSLQINPGLGVKMSKDSWQALPSVPIGPHNDIHPVHIIWSGDVLCIESANDDSPSVDGHISETTEDPDSQSEPRQYTRQALLHPTVQGSGVIQILQEGLDLRDILVKIPTKCIKAKPFSMTMMEQAWSKLGAFVDQVDSDLRGDPLYRLDRMPASLHDCFRSSNPAPDTAADAKPAPSKPLPGESVNEIEVAPANLTTAETIDDLCLGIRKAYIEHLYKDEHSVTDYVKQLNAATKEITALAAIQSVPLKEAQQKLVAFIIEFLRIWPSKMASKYKQLGKEVNVGKTVESKAQDHYAILEDERPELDTWKAEVMKCVKDTDVRMHLRRLKTKDTQIQIVQNLHILLLLDKYELEENKPFKKDPGALRTTNLFMDELCIAASIEDRPAPGLMSPQTPRSKDMDPAKKFFTRVVARFYGPSLPKVVERLSIKCGAEKSLLTSPRPSRSKRAGMIKRSMSMGVLQKPSPLDLSLATQSSTDPNISSSSVTTPKDGAAPKHGFPMSRQSTSDNPTRNVLNSSLFRNRQVTMTRGSVKGLDAVSTGVSSSSLYSRQTKSTKPVLVHSQSQSALQRLQTTTVPDDEMEDEDAPPKLAKLKLKKFYHDKESEEVLKVFRRKGPLSKADAIGRNDGSQGNHQNDRSSDKEEDEGDMAPSNGSLAAKGTTSWGVIKSMNVSSSATISEGLQSPSTGAERRRYSPVKKRDPTSPSQRPLDSFMTSLSLPADSFVPSTPSSRHGYRQEDDNGSYLQRMPSTPSGRAQFRRHHSQQIFSHHELVQTDDNTSTRQLFVPSTPTRRNYIHQARTFASQIRGEPTPGFTDNSVLGSPGKRRRVGGIDSDEDEDGDIYTNDGNTSGRPSQRYMQSLQRKSLQRAQTTSMLLSHSPSANRQAVTSLFSDDMRPVRPDRKRVHMDGLLGATSAAPRTVLVPGTPSSKLSSNRTSAATAFHSSFLSSTTAETNEENGGREPVLQSTPTLSSMSSSLLLSTPTSKAKSAAAAAAHFEMFISSPTMARDAPRRRIDFSMFAADD
ncbi:hypothetical protein BGX28_000547 [Mortierella sp. GBA30]|nr:hypothetical protein BGX28_000547 [Mortierella sp. GBA30]